MRAAALGALLAGCYSPSFQDCAITCPDGTTCPSGYTCNSSSRVCEPDGAGGSCGSNGRTDGGGGDGGGGDAMPSFCAMQSGYVLCQDFDGVPLTQQGWDSSDITPPSTVTVVGNAGARSAPNILESSLTAADNQAARMIDITTPGTPNNITYGVSVNIAERSMFNSTPLAPLTLFEVSAGYQLVLEDLGGGMLRAGCPQVAMSMMFTVTPGWRRLEFRVAMGGNQYNAHLAIDGDDAGIFANVPISTVGPQWDVFVGAKSSGTNGTTRVQYDNLLVTTQ